MRKVRSLRRIIINRVLFFGLAFILGYSVLLIDFGDRGLDLAVEMRLNMELEAYSKQFALTPEIPLPEYTNFKTYLGYDTLPVKIRDAIPEKIFYSKQLEVWDPPHGELMQFIYPWQRPDDNWVYFVFTVHLNDSTERIMADLDHMLSFIGQVGLTVLAIIVILMLGSLHHLSHSINKLRAWANSLQIKKLDQQKKVFRYQELNEIADVIHDNTKRIAAGVKREQRFLEHASHELRTPIAILQNNLELLEYKGLSKDPRFAASFSRMSNAVNNMHHLTTTLLWASRNESAPPVATKVNLEALIEDLIAENNYLLKNKQVLVSTSLSNETIIVSKHVLRIILGNIIRNAFQHTDEGEISIHNTADTFVVFNSKSSEGTVSDTESYGLGIMLIERLVTKMGWDITFDDSDTFFAVTLQMSNVTPKSIEKDSL
ncbi:sensor histidine kinase [Halodesulfovibrio marinisediminis]|uniref:histidine kinase n=1 Tax=Halodesulfovibrio marinisediminis DSM 17456 TaxID=1121457 RepID=A0A1N6GQL4_9BACT|nr:HAMP domain-containing sensor histidine kinase [Halodesulfovibrio marinisediminis]SIO09767.1 Signal transduction histidine kinase [Halodesulfovibrio marinisediminis DSM 17456]